MTDTDSPAVLRAEEAWALRDTKPREAEMLAEMSRTLARFDIEDSCADVVEGYIAWRDLRPVDADRLLDSAAAALENSVHHLWHLRALGTRGAFLADSGLHHIAIGVLLSALEVAHEVEASEFLFWINQNIGLALLEVGSYTASEERFALAAEWADHATFGPEYLAVNRATLYMAAGRLSEAVDTLRENRYLWADSEPSHARGRGLITEAKIALAAHSFDECAQSLAEARDCFVALGRSEPELFALEARLRFAQGNVNEAATFVEEFGSVQGRAALDADETPNHQLLELRSELAEARGDWEQALGLFKDAISARDGALRQRTSLLMARHAEEVRRRSERLAAKNDELQSQKARADQESRRDYLTGLFNRRHLTERAKALFASVGDDRPPIALVLIDVDRFKEVNDTFLHAAGDAVLCGLADIMLQCARISDVVCRLGGDEFVVLLSGADKAGAETYVHRLTELIASHPWSDIAQGLEVSVSCGIALAEEADTLDTLLSGADAQMYSAKRQSKARVG